MEKMAMETVHLDTLYSHTILPDNKVSDLLNVSGFVDPTNKVEYKDDSGVVCSPDPLFIPEEVQPPQKTAETAKPVKQENIMQTFLKMSSVVYSMAGLGSIEESKVYREKFPSEDSLKQEAGDASPRPDKREDDALSEEDDENVFKEQLGVPDHHSRRGSHLPSVSEVGKTIDILLKETDTLWMFILPGTCKEIEVDEKGQRKTTKSDKGVDAETEAADGDEADGDNKKAKKTKSIMHKYDLNQKWSQTIDFPRKKKGTQTDPIPTENSTAQVTSKDLLL